MINYTERLTLLIDDVVARVPALGYIDTRRLLVFARFGRSETEGAYATCHSLTLPQSEPGYYFWRDRRSGRITRRSEWFVTKSPDVRVGGRPIDYMLSFCLPRFSDQTCTRARKHGLYGDADAWLAKLDTVVHELYHIAPDGQGIRRILRRDGTVSSYAHSPQFFTDVASFVRAYLASSPDPDTYEFLRLDFKGLVSRYGGVVGTTFRGFPSFPQRYQEVAADQPAVDGLDVPIVPVRAPRMQHRYTEDDLHVREFCDETSRRLVRTGRFRAA